MHNVNLKELFILLIEKTKQKADLELKVEDLQKQKFFGEPKNFDALKDEIALAKKKISDISETIKYVEFRINKMDELQREYYEKNNELINECITALKEE